MTQPDQTSTLSSPTSPKRWLITGGCGFIGRNLIKSLLEQGGHQIRVIDNLKVGTRSDLSQVCNYEEVTPEDLSSTLYPLSSFLFPLSSILFPLSSFLYPLSSFL